MILPPYEVAERLLNHHMAVLSSSSDKQRRYLLRLQSLVEALSRGDIDLDQPPVTVIFTPPDTVVIPDGIRVIGSSNTPFSLDGIWTGPICQGPPERSPHDPGSSPVPGQHP